MKTVQGKTAVVTGGGSGIGRGIAVTLANQGAQVVVADVDLDAAAETAKHIDAAGGAALAVQTDVADLDSMRALADATSSRFGPAQIVCNNAGVAYQCHGVDATHEDWMWMMGVNLWGVIHGIEVFLPPMVASGEEGHIVNTSSMNGFIPSSFSPMYSVAKYGVVGLTDVLRNELRDTKVGISVLCPAGVKTRIMSSERNRPESLRRPTTLPAQTPSSTFDVSPPADPDEVGALTLQGILRNQFYIFTDMKVKALIQQHHERIMQDFDYLAEWQSNRVGEV
jgi:NAD(P)-dependent dehydrogenase (short-subunit alcohol dehydrogenase family)